MNATPSPAEDAVFRVVGPEAVTDGSAAPTSPYEPVLACSLHPLGFGFPDTLPDGVADYVDVRTFPDAFLGVPDDGRGAPAWRGGAEEGEQTLDQRSLLAPLHDDNADADARLLVVPGTDDAPLDVVRTTLVRPLLGTGSTVVVVGGTVDDGGERSPRSDHADRLDRIAATERATRG